MEIAQETNRFSPNPPLPSPHPPHITGRLGGSPPPGSGPGGAVRGPEGAGGPGVLPETPGLPRASHLLEGQCSCPWLWLLSAAESLRKNAWGDQEIPPSSMHERDPRISSQNQAGVLQIPPAHPMLFQTLHQSALGPEKHPLECPLPHSPRSLPSHAPHTRSILSSFPD